MIRTTQEDAQVRIAQLRDSFETIASCPLLSRTPARLVSVLVVEDNDDDSFLLCEKLSHFQCQVQKAASVAEALEVLAKSVVDVVLVDIVLGCGVLGDELVKQARELYPSMKFITVTGLIGERNADPGNQPALLRGMVEAGTSMTILKPVGNDTLRLLFREK